MATYKSLVVTTVLAFGILSVESSAALRPDKVHTADGKKTEAYVADGLVVGGDRAVNQVAIKDIRRAANQNFDRIVIDFEASRNGEALAIPRAPYFQVAVNPEENRVIISFWGKPKLAFDARRVVTAFKKSPMIESVDLLPKVDEDTWTFALNLKSRTPVEVFELGQPARVILDVKAGKRSK
jgi:hypothetical protein